MWSYAHAARTGAVHADEEGQDRFGVAVAGGGLVLCVSDGAGSARLGGEGASVACRAFVERFGELLARKKKPSESEISEAFRSIRVAIGEEALELDCPMEDLSCTLVGAAIGPKETLFVQVGDGAGVVARRKGGDFKHEVAIWPDGAEVVNETTFVTSPTAEEQLRVQRLPTPKGVALFTDGIQYLVLDHTTKQPHKPFFDAVFKPAERPLQSGLSGEDAAVSQWLEGMLASPMVTSKTDDDTCIVVAWRSS